MVQLTRIYTKSGDKGKTSLGNGQRISKSSPRIEAIGSVDELNCFMGLAALKTKNQDIAKLIFRIQNDLFDLGADLCLPETDEDPGYTPLRMTADQVENLEAQIDLYNLELSDLKSFILPGGTESAATLHLARGIARRAERLVINVSETETISPPVIQYINRLSDLLFVLARYENNKGQDEILWVPGENR